MATTLIDIEIIILSDVSQRKTDIILYHLYVNLKKMIRVNLGTVSQAWGKLGV